MGMRSLDWRVEAPSDSAPSRLLEEAVLLAGVLGVEGGVEVALTLRTDPNSPLCLLPSVGEGSTEQLRAQCLLGHLGLDGQFLRSKGRDIPGCPVVGTWPSGAGGAGSIPGGKISHASRPRKPKHKAEAVL